MNRISPPGNWVEPPRAGAAHQVARQGEAYCPLVCRVDADGNEVAGIRLPDIAVPLATFTGWNVYKAPYPEGELADRDGSILAFAADETTRRASGDPRASISRRYAGRDDYVERVRQAAQSLVRERLLLAHDADAFVERARGDIRLDYLADSSGSKDIDPFVNPVPGRA